MKPKKIPKKIIKKPMPEVAPSSLKELSSHLDVNISYLKNQLQDCSDVVFRKLETRDQDVWLVYTDNMINATLLTEGIMKVFSTHSLLNSGPPVSDLIKALEDIIPVGEVSFETKTLEILFKILNSHIVLLFNDETKAMVINLPGFERRGIEASEIEPSIKGPKESFTETLGVNIALIRRRIPHPDCKIINLSLGKYSKTQIAVLYIDSIANGKIVKEILRRLNQIEVGTTIGTGTVEEMIKDAPYSPFPTMQDTDRPDKVAFSLMEGRVAILQDNHPFALLAPSCFFSFFQSVDDYYRSFYVGTLLRSFRYLSVFLSVFLPGLYVSLTNFHQEMIPTSLLITLANQREGVPFPAVIEAVFMGLAFEILKEAGTRLPKPIGQAVSIVGALIIGEAAVNAGIISPSIVIVTALTAIASFTVPAQELETPLMIFRLTFTIISGLLGIWGILIVVIIILGHLVSLRSFGIPYTVPLAPLHIEDLDDVLVRAPLWVNKKRPVLLTKNTKRQRKIKIHY